MTATSGAGKASQLTQEPIQFVVPLPNPMNPVSGTLVAPLPAHELFRFRFTTTTKASVSEREASIPLNPSAERIAEEIWLTHSAVKSCSQNGMTFSECQEYQFCCYIADATSPDDIRDQAESAYTKILRTASERGYPHPIRAWNFFPQITEGDGDKECYRQFSVGRAHAFDDLGLTKQDYPAGTAIGTHDDSSLLIILISGRTPANNVENPRQTSAYDYPRQYGPVGPSFARASLLELGNEKQLLISGTASIVGSKSQHTDDLLNQLEETLTNVLTLAAHCGWKKQDRAPHKAPLLRVYLRSAQNLATIEQRIHAELGEDARIFFLHGDICRTELLLEIESIFWID
jgi:chorismate lyase/3-hydroxybenzoate synthase